MFNILILLRIEGINNIIEEWIGYASLHFYRYQLKQFRNFQKDEENKSNNKTVSPSRIYL